LEAAAAARADALCVQISVLLASKACVDEHTADQLVVFMALAKGTSRLLVPPREMLTSLHLETVATFAAQLTGARITVRAVPRGQTAKAATVGMGADGSARSAIAAAEAEACLMVECEGAGVTLPP
jgi:RNA 3'-terminal phosphate cyclase